MNAYSRLTLTLLSTALLLPNNVASQVSVSTPCAASSQVNPPSEPQQLPDVKTSIFYEALKPHGDWVEHKTYGLVWYPRDVDKNWRPYTNGHWARTREYGWLWVANEPWGWATFHYGRWAWDDWYGWVWIAGQTWAPAWVFWRSGGGYTAWAAMPPNAVWQPNVGMNVQYFNYNHLHQDSWVAVCNDAIVAENISTKCYPAASNYAIINQTKIIEQSNIIQHNNNIRKNVSVLQNTIANRPPIPVINSPIVPVSIETAVPTKVTATNTNTASPVIIQPEMPELTPEQVADEIRLAKVLAEQNAATRSTGANQQPREAGRFTGAINPETIAPTLPPQNQSQLPAEQQTTQQTVEQEQQNIEVAEEKVECKVDCKVEGTQLIGSSPLDNTKLDYYSSPPILGNRITTNPELIEQSGRKKPTLIRLWLDKQAANNVR